ncbi:hypothetical protein LOK49_Contig369G00003 [Camellia lanceoleosa]|nr:hypothetical protein LOK49_Contig369G00003 [Camellia lanceoleosa]
MNFLANLRIADPLFVQHVQTPEGSLLDIIRNAYDLLSHCDIKIPKIEGNDKYVDSGPPYLIFLHPALGPLWEVTRQKVRDEEKTIGLIRKYGLMCCRQCFRSNAKEIGFIKVNLRFPPPTR